MTELIQPIQNDSFLNLLDELRDELEMISTTNALTTNVDGDDDIENAVTTCQAIVDTIAADLVAKQKYQESGYVHISQGLPVNTLNNDVLYVGINSKGFACVFNYLSITTLNHFTNHNCHYVTPEETYHQMDDLMWWKILEFPTFQDFYNEGVAANSSAFITNRTIDSNPYPKGSPEHRHWKNGWMSADELPF